MASLAKSLAAPRFLANTLRTAAIRRRTLSCSNRRFSEPAQEDRLPHTTALDSKPGGQPVGEPSGPYSRADSETKKYATTDKEEPYNVPKKGMRYGGMPQLKESRDKGPDQSDAGEGPDGSESGGRMPEGRKPHNAA
ncbi:hypothetical protein EV121DRAFT_287834 [Schizophyllum commune]